MIASTLKESYQYQFLIRNVRPAPRPVRREEQAAKPTARKPSNSRRSEAKQPERARSAPASKNPSRNERDNRGGGRGKKVWTHACS